MDKEIFVQKVKFLCLQKGIKPTNACKESGVGGSFLNNIERGNVPTVTKVEKLAAYLGTTVSELIGECPPEVPAFPEHPDLVLLYDQLSETAQKEVMEFIEFKAMQETKAVEGSVSMKKLGDTRPAGVREMDNQKREKKTGDI